MALLGMTQKDYVRLTKQLNAADTNLSDNTSQILSLFLLITKLFISIMNYFFMRLFYSATGTNKNKFIWINVVSFVFSYILAAFAQNITEYIMNATVFCYAFE